MELISFPRIMHPEDCTLDDFLNKCSDIRVEEVHVEIDRKDPDKNFLPHLQSLVYIPYSIAFNGIYNGDIFYRLTERIFAHVPHSRADGRYVRGLTGGDSAERIREYGIEYAAHCTRRGFNTKLSIEGEAVDTSNILKRVESDTTLPYGLIL